MHHCSQSLLLCLVWSTQLIVKVLTQAVSCSVSSADPGPALAAGPCAAAPQTLLPVAGAAGGVQPQQGVHRQGVCPPARASRRPPSPHWPGTRRPAVQRRGGPRRREGDGAGVTRHLVATVRVLEAGDQLLGPSPGLELGPPPGLAAQGRPRPAAAALDATVRLRSEVEENPEGRVEAVSYTVSSSCFMFSVWF